MSEHELSTSPPPTESGTYEELVTEAPVEPPAEFSEAVLEEHAATPVPASVTTRTVGIIKTHALDHRFDIEHRISEAGFEIVKERQMEFDVETDPDTMFDLFGEDYGSFAEGPVWVYVLERRRAVEVWGSLMGNPDPEVARRDTPNSLRALYGLSREQNAVMGAPDEQTAEIQIEAIFASSPPFPTTELPDVGQDAVPAGSLRSVSSSVLEALRYSMSNGGSVTSPTSEGSGGAKAFKARALPVTHIAPDIVPRTSRAAALRAGIVIESPKRAPPTAERLAETFANVPGHKRSESIKVASTAPPVVAPRMTRAAALRLGQQPPQKTRRPSTAGAIPEVENKATFVGVPGHKRRESIAVASTKPPTVAPRSNRSASLRATKEVAPPTSFMFRQATAQTPSRSSSRTSFNQSTSVSVVRPASSASVRPVSARPTPTRITSNPPSTASRPPVTRRSSSISRPSTSASITSAAIETLSTPETPAKPKVARAPSITPRTNKSALLRAAKMANASAPAVPTKAKPAAATPRAIRA